MALELSRLIPAHVELHRFNWLKHDFTTMGEQYRRIRMKCGGTMMECHWCGHKFEDGEQIGLAQPTANGEGNWVLCQGCCTIMRASENGEAGTA